MRRIEELREGEVTSKELANWFSVTSSTFSQTKEKKIDLLNRYYCDIEALPQRGKYKISNIREEVYDKNKQISLTREIFIDSWKDGEGDIIAHRIKRLFPQYQKLDDKKETIETVSGRVYRLKKKWLGGWDKKLGYQVSGIRGDCSKEWCRLIKGAFIPISAEEKDIRYAILKKHLKNMDEKSREEAKEVFQELEDDKIEFSEFKKKVFDIGSFNREAYNKDIIKEFGSDLYCVNVFHAHVEHKPDLEIQNWLKN